jgi:outer membrane protein
MKGRGLLIGLTLCLASVGAGAVAAPSDENSGGAPPAGSAAPAAASRGAAPAGEEAAPSNAPPGSLPSSATLPGARKRATVTGLLTVDRAAEIALRDSPVVRGAVEEVNIAVQELRTAQAQRRPILSTTAFLSTGTNPSITTTPAPVMPQMLMGLPRSGFYDQNLSLMVPLYTGGRLQALVRRAEAARRASSADLAEVKLETALLTRVAYRTAQVRQEFLTVYQDVVRTNEERVRIDRIAYAEGRIAQYPVLRDEAELANATQQLAYAQRDREMALVQLRTLMGVQFAPDVTLEGTPPFQPVAALLSALPAFPNPAPQPPATMGPAGPEPRPVVAGAAITPQSESAATAATSPELERLLRLAEQGRPALEAQRLRLQSARQGIKAARSAYLPQVSLFAMGDAMQGRSIDPFSGYTAGVAIGLPILDGGSRRAEVRRAQAEQRRQDEELQRTVLQVTQEVTDNWLALQVAERNVATAQAGVRSGSEDYRIAQIRYAEGKSINVEALDALATRTRAQVNLAQAQFEYQIAADQLRRSLGMQ